MAKGGLRQRGRGSAKPAESGASADAVILLCGWKMQEEA